MGEARPCAFQRSSDSKGNKISIRRTCYRARLCSSRGSAQPLRTMQDGSIVLDALEIPTIFFSVKCTRQVERDLFETPARHPAGHKHCELCDQGRTACRAQPSQIHRKVGGLALSVFTQAESLYGLACKPHATELRDEVKGFLPHPSRFFCGTPPSRRVNGELRATQRRTRAAAQP